MIANYFPVRPDKAPKAQFRGKGKYYRHILQKAHTFSLPLDDGSWFDTWHYHADWPGYGNLGWQHRKLHIETLCVVFQRITQQVADFSTPFQLWISLNLQDAGQDAVYFHTPNPNQTAFPVNLPHITWGFSELEQLLAQWLDPLQLRAGIGIWEGNRQFYVYSTTQGRPLE